MSTPGRKRVQPILIDDDDDEDDEEAEQRDEKLVSSSSIKSNVHVNIDNIQHSSSSSLSDPSANQSTTIGQKHIFVALNFDELSHIRNVQTNSEYATLLYDFQLYKTVVNGQICFSCRKRKFSFLHPGVRCGICLQRICHRCQRQLTLRSDKICFVSLNLLRRSSSSIAEMNLTTTNERKATTQLSTKKITRTTLSKNSFSSCLDCFILFHPI